MLTFLSLLPWPCTWCFEFTPHGGHGHVHMYFSCCFFCLSYVALLFDFFVLLCQYSLLSNNYRDHIICAMSRCMLASFKNLISYHNDNIINITYKNYNLAKIGVSFCTDPWTAFRMSSVCSIALFHTACSIQHHGSS